MEKWDDHYPDVEKPPQEEWGLEEIDGKVVDVIYIQLPAATPPPRQSSVLVQLIE